MWSGTALCGVWISPRDGSDKLSVIFVFQQVLRSCEITAQGKVVVKYTRAVGKGFSINFNVVPLWLFLEGSVVISQAGKKIRKVLMLEGAELSREESCSWMWKSNKHSLS